MHIETFTIVGFPGETDREFEELVSFICSIDTEHFVNYSTAFSLRYGTEAYTMTGRISQDVIKYRVKRINQAYLAKAEKRLKKINPVIREQVLNLIKATMKHAIEYEESAEG